MGLGFWLLVWVMMTLAFTSAWGFIIRGCEAMDELESRREEESAG